MRKLASVIAPVIQNNGQHQLLGPPWTATDIRISTFGARELAPGPLPTHMLKNLSPEVSPRIVLPMLALVLPLGSTATYPPRSKVIERYHTLVHFRRHFSRIGVFLRCSCFT